MRATIWTTIAIFGCSSETVSVKPAGLDGVAVVPDNPTCADLGLGAFAIKVDPPVGGTYSLDEHNTVTVTVDPTGTYLGWTATIGMDAVIVKGGPMANVYTYDPESFGSTGLTAPLNSSNGTPYAISHFDFCFDYELAVAKTAHTSLTRTYQWAIDKSAPLSALTLAVGEIYSMAYSVVVTRTGFVDSDWAAGGAVTITNPSPYAAEISTITDLLDGITPVSLDCGVTLPYSLAAWATLQCTYSLALTDASSHLNEVTVDTCGTVGGGSASAEVDFGSATITERDNCVDIADDHAGALGTACDSQTFGYSLNIGPYAQCGTSENFVNTASFVACDTGANGSDSWTVAVTVPDCPVGCTLTQGYWKTHSSYGPAPSDPIWNDLTAGPNTVFFLSGKTYFQVLWTAPKGSAYYVLAHQYIAAQLNIFAGASDGAVATQLAQATQLFQTYTPVQIAALGTGSPIRQQMLSIATTLDEYNSGLIGPGHCDE